MTLRSALFGQQPPRDFLSPSRDLPYSDPDSARICRSRFIFFDKSYEGPYPDKQLTPRSGIVLFDYNKQKRGVMSDEIYEALKKRGGL